MKRQEQIAFLEQEIKAELDKFKTTAICPAKSLLQDAVIYIALFQKIEHGQAILKFSTKRAVPRKNEFLLALVPADKDRNYKTWDSQSYKYLIENALSSSACHCVWTAAGDDENYFLAGFRGFSLEFATKLKPGTAIILGPDAPPVTYLSNLIKVLQSSRDDNFAAAMQETLRVPNWQGIADSNNSTIRFLNALNENDIIMIQGPPGTGKTYQMAALCKALLDNGKSVLFTALTNRALMELVEKDSLWNKINEGKVHKMSLSTDEIERLPELKNADKMICSPGHLCLATYYKMSDFAVMAEKPFDYVIADESSQAILATFAAALRCGKKQIWIGDPMQLPPISALSSDIIRKLNSIPALNGMQTVAKTTLIPCFQFTETYRLTQRAANFTGLFYENKLMSKSPLSLTKNTFPEKLRNLLPEDGGPIWIKTKMEIGENAPKSALKKVSELLNELKGFLPENKKPDIAVLSFFIATVRALQREIHQNLSRSEDILVDTVSRIQGLTCDICIFVIPNSSLNFSLDSSLFNVATSRARYFTFIIADGDTCTSAGKAVKVFLQTAEKL